MARGDERHTGADAIVSVPNGNDIPVSNVSWDHDVNTTEVQHSGTGGAGSNPLNAAIAITGLRYSGSFDYDGKNEDLRQQLFKDNGEPERVTMTVREEPGEGSTTSRTFTFENVIVTGMSRDVPADDVSSTSWDFAAENLVVN
jgi:hypothetical protein